MKIFNIDQHISVVGDLKGIFRDLGHTIDDICLSAHAPLMGRKTDSIPYLDGDKWGGFVQRREWDRFHAEMHEKLDSYDALLVCYPPVFMYLYHNFDKPIIVDLPIRYDYCMDADSETLLPYIQYIREGVDSGKIILCANNNYDRAYCENYVNRPVKHIPSLCEYTGMNYLNDPEKENAWLYYSMRRVKEMPPNFIKKHDALAFGHPWSDLVKFLGIAHVPYNVSTMSVFEQYTANIPLFFPSKRFMLKLYEERLPEFLAMLKSHKDGVKYDYRDIYFVLEQVSWSMVYNRPPKTNAVGAMSVDLNEYTSLKTVEYWLDHADYYDEKWMPFIGYFDSYEHLASMARPDRVLATAYAMKKHNEWRKREVYRRWEELLKRI